MVNKNNQNKEELKKMLVWTMEQKVDSELILQGMRLDGKDRRSAEANYVEGQIKAYATVAQKISKMMGLP